VALGSDQDRRVRLLQRPQPGQDRGEVNELAMELRIFLSPDGLHRPHLLPQHPVAHFRADPWLCTVSSCPTPIPNSNRSADS
jgi:hypothetical protein